MTQDSFISSVKRNNQRLFLIALSFTQNYSDAEDVLQNVFLKLWNYNSDFCDDLHIDKWLTAVCVNESKNLLKSPFRKRNVALDDVNEAYSFEDDESYDLFKAVMQLPKKERIVIHLFYYEDMPVKEISSLLRINQNAVRTRLHRARNKLKEILGDEWIND